MQVMLRQAAEEKESAIKMRAALQAELAQKQPHPHMPCAASAVATSQELQRSRLHLEAWAAAHTVDGVMQRMLSELCHSQQQPHVPDACALAAALEPERVLEMCTAMAHASEWLLQPVAAPADSSRGSQQANERHERAAAQAAAARDAALKQNAQLQEVGVGARSLRQPRLTRACRCATTSLLRSST
jgi:hypothetical protein